MNFIAVLNRAYVFNLFLCFVRTEYSNTTYSNFRFHKQHNWTVHHPHSTTHSRLEHTSSQPHSSKLHDHNEKSDGTSEEHEFDSDRRQDDTEEHNLTIYDNMLNDVWLDLQTTNDILGGREYDNSSGVQALRSAYQYTARKSRVRTLPAGYRNPFIAIEGLDREKSFGLAKMLAHYLDGAVLLNPPDGFDPLRQALNTTLLQNAFYSMSVYIVAFRVRMAMQKFPAVVSGYWLGSAAYTLVKRFPNNLPPFETKFWKWPADLLKPDAIFYLAESEDDSYYQPDAPLRERFLSVFDNWIDPKCIPITHTDNNEEMMEEVIPYLQSL